MRWVIMRALRPAILVVGQGREVQNLGQALDPRVGMEPYLTTVMATLAELHDTELAALINATYGVAQTAPGLLAPMRSALDWPQSSAMRCGRFWPSRAKAEFKLIAANQSFKASQQGKS